MYNNFQMKVFNYIINKLDLRICKPSQAITLKFLHFPAFFSGHFAIAFFEVNNEN